MKKLIKFNSIIAIIAVVFLASCTKNEVTKVTISDSSLTLLIGQTDSLYADIDYTGDIAPSVIWSSSNPAVVSINGGEIKALKAGTATITATAGNKTATCVITVSNEINVLNVTMSYSSLALFVGQIDSLSVEADYTGDIAPTIVWSSSNPAIVSINGGEIEALKTGTATITATAGTKAATCVITVSDEINATFVGGVLAYWGDYYEGGISNNYQTYLVSNSNDTLVLEFNTSLSAVDNIPSGSYTMVDTQDYTTFSDYVPNTLVAYNFDQGYGSAFFNKTFGTGLAEGSAVVTNTNNNYKIEYSLIDYMGNSLVGTYNGTLDFYDGTQSATISAAKISKKNLSKRMMLKKQ